MSDLSRMQAEYQLRKQRVSTSKIYSAFDPAYMFLKQQRQREISRLLERQGFADLKTAKILEVGCGSGTVLVELLGMGAREHNLFGAELIFERTAAAHQRLPAAGVVCSDGQALPYAAHSFDIVAQFMALSSILDATVRQNVACEMMRLVRPGGIILWYDFWVNPSNPHTRGIRPDEIRAYFPRASFAFRRTTLAPPVARRLVSVSWILAMLLEKLSLLNSHYLAVIRPQTSGS